MRGKVVGLPAYALAYAVIGAAMGAFSAFLVPNGPRVGLHGQPGLPASTGPVGALEPIGSVPYPRLVAAGAASYGHVLSVGVLIAFASCLGFGLAARLSTGERLLALAPVAGWLVPALLAMSDIRGDILLPAGGVVPSVEFLYAGVLGGGVTLLPATLLPSRLRVRMGRDRVE